MRRLIKIRRRKKNKGLVDTRVLTSRIVEIEDDGLGSLFNPEESITSEEVWLDTIIDISDVMAVTENPDHSFSSILWIPSGNIITSTDIKESEEWLNRKGSNLLETRIKIADRAEEGVWVRTIIDLSSVKMISYSNIGGRAVIWLGEERVIVEDSYEQVRKRVMH